MTTHIVDRCVAIPGANATRNTREEFPTWEQAKAREAELLRTGVMAVAWSITEACEVGAYGPNRSETYPNDTAVVQAGFDRSNEGAA